MAHPRGELAVVVRCADPRLDPFFTLKAARASMGFPPRDVLPSEGKTRPMEAIISNVGGLLPFVDDPTRLAEDAGLLVSLFAEGRARIVLTAHSSCGGYRAALGDVAPADRAERIQRDHLRRAVAVLRERIPDAETAAYFLNLETGAVAPVED